MANNEIKCGHAGEPCVEGVHPVAARELGRCFFCPMVVVDAYAKVRGSQPQGFFEHPNIGTVAVHEGQRGDS
jgi:hypothetical protein